MAGEAGFCLPGEPGFPAAEPSVQEDASVLAGQSAGVRCTVLLGRCCQGGCTGGGSVAGGETSCIS